MPLLHYMKIKETLRLEYLSLVKTLQLNFTCVLQLQKGNAKLTPGRFCLQGTMITPVCLFVCRERSGKGAVRVHCFLSKEFVILDASLRSHIIFMHFHGKVNNPGAQPRNVIIYSC